MRRAQSTQVYVIVGVIFFFGIVLGFKLIYDFIQTSSDIRLMEFNTRLKNDVDAISIKPGAVQRYTYNLPYRTKRVCFYDTSASVPGLIPENPMLRSMIEEHNNIFLMGGYSVKGIAVKNIKAPTGFYCVNASRNRVELFLEGSGTAAMIKKSE